MQSVGEQLLMTCWIVSFFSGWSSWGCCSRRRGCRGRGGGNAGVNWKWKSTSCGDSLQGAVFGWPPSKSTKRERGCFQLLNNSPILKPKASLFENFVIVFYPNYSIMKPFEIHYEKYKTQDSFQWALGKPSYKKNGKKSGHSLSEKSA